MYDEERIDFMAEQGESTSATGSTTTAAVRGGTKVQQQQPVRKVRPQSTGYMSSLAARMGTMNMDMSNTLVSTPAVALTMNKCLHRQVFESRVQYVQTVVH